MLHVNKFKTLARYLGIYGISKYVVILAKSGAKRLSFVSFKGHPHARIMYPRFWAEFVAV